MLRGSLRVAGIGVFVVTLCALVFSGVTAFAFSGSGAGTNVDPYQITTCAQLQSINLELDASYELANDIDCTSASGSWTPIGAVGAGFTGTLDGQNHKITNLDLSGISDTTNFAGMFSAIEGSAVVKDLSIIDSELNAGNNSGMITGGLYDSATLDDVYAQATITCHGDNCGGLVGSQHDASVINNSGADVTVANNDISTGGLVGWVSGAGTIQQSFANGFISGTLYVGGLIGAVNTISGVATVTNTYANATVEGDEYVGGIAGMAAELNLTNSYAVGSASGTNSIGGLVGYFYGHMAETFAAVHVTGTGGSVGAVTGHFQGGTVGNRYFDTSISGFSGSPDGSSPISNSDYFKNNSTNPPLNQWNFSTVWRTNYANYPSFAPKVDPYMLCEQPQATATTMSAACDVAPLGWGTPTWQARWSVKGSNDWHTITLSNSNRASATVTGLNPNTEYELAFRYTNDFGTGPWGVVSILTLAAPSSNASSGSGTALPSILQTTSSATSTRATTVATTDVTSTVADQTTLPAAENTIIKADDSTSREIASPTASNTEESKSYNWAAIGGATIVAAGALWIAVRYIHHRHPPQ